jgi:hypothetical protein
MQDKLRVLASTAMLVCASARVACLSQAPVQAAGLLPLTAQGSFSEAISQLTVTIAALVIGCAGLATR